MVKTFSQAASEIARLLERQQRLDNVPDQVPVHELFQEILKVANQFVPSESGSVLIDDPAIKVNSQWEPADNELVFVACFGEKAERLIGRRIRADQGIVGKTYLTGEPAISSDVRSDEAHFKEIDREVQYETRSVVCVPIRIGRSTCGVLELINHRDKVTYENSELQLLEIFAAYISTSLQNVLDANRYRELAKRDDLTGLYNDRYFNQRLSEEVEKAESDGGDLGLLFLDLDHFKQVNDNHGHLVGSRTLREVGLILASTVTPDEATVARYGGDEFVMIVPSADIDAVAELGERVRTRISEAVFRIDQGSDDTGVLLQQGAITASIGVASYQELEFEPSLKLRHRKNEFVRSADQAMYKAKAMGKNRVCLGGYARTSTSVRF